MRLRLRASLLNVRNLDRQTFSFPAIEANCPVCPSPPVRDPAIGQVLALLAGVGKEGQGLTGTGPA